MVKVMKRGGRGHLVNEPFNKTLQRVVSRVDLSRIANVVTSGPVLTLYWTIVWAFCLDAFFPS
jgi:hypothetical protein